MEKKNVDFLNICCQKNDVIYKLLRPLAISIYPYTLLSNFEIAKNSEVKIDVRCL